jgi:hypothetical protein
MSDRPTVERQMLYLPAWGATYETPWTRSRKKLNHVSIPNDNYYLAKLRRIKPKTRVAEAFGVLAAVCAVASRCPIRGVLWRYEAEGPLDSADMAELTELPQRSFDRSIPLLIAAGLVAAQQVIASADGWRFPNWLHLQCAPVTPHRSRAQLKVLPAPDVAAGGYLNGRSHSPK